MTSKYKIEKFKKWLIQNGAEILPSTNPYEALRFKGSETGVLYTSGKVANPYTSKAISCFKHKSKWDGRPLNVGRKNTYKSEKAKLLKRDGDSCFYCGKKLNDDVTLEHIVSLTSGGKNTLGNMVLAHEECNHTAGNMTVKRKMDLAFRLRYEYKLEKVSKV